jgi:GNAT superfamily N-acetyltransferase
MDFHIESIHPDDDQDNIRKLWISGILEVQGDTTDTRKFIDSALSSDMKDIYSHYSNNGTFLILYHKSEIPKSKSGTHSSSFPIDLNQLEIPKSKSGTHSSSFPIDLNQSEILGFIGISKIPRYVNIYELQRVFVVKEYRNRGIGKYLVSEAIKWFHNIKTTMNNSKLQLWVTSYYSNTIAINMWEKLGFVKQKDNPRLKNFIRASLK